MAFPSVVYNAEYFHSLQNEHASEYYHKGNVESFWQGKLAEKHGLKDKEVKIKNVKALLGNIKSKRLGVDVCYSAPKSVSIAYAVLGDERVKEAHIKAVRVANEYLEKHLAETRQGRAGAERVKASGVAIANYVHETSRSNDPQLHTHAVVLNVVIRATDKKLTALEPRKIFKFQKTLGQIYRNELAKNLQELGYKIEPQRNGFFEIKGIDKKVLKVFSERSQHLNQALGKLQERYANASVNKLKDIAAKKTRSEKQFLSKERLQSLWDKKLRSIGTSREKLKQAVSSETFKSKPEELTKEEIKQCVKEAAEKLAQDKGAFSKGELIREALFKALEKAGIDKKIPTAKKVEKAINQLKRDKYLRKIQKDKLTTWERYQELKFQNKIKTQEESKLKTEVKSIKAEKTHSAPSQSIKAEKTHSAPSQSMGR